MSKLPSSYRKTRYTIPLILVGLLISFFLLRAPDIPLEELKEKYSNDASQFVEIDGTQIHYRIEGSGPNLVLLHGTAASLHTWDGWVKELQNDYRIIRMDLPAYGLTGPSKNKEYSAPAYSKFLNTFLEEVGVDTFHLAGNSLGGRIAWQHALQHPEKIDKLVLVDPAGFPQEMPGILKLARTPILNQIVKQFTSKSLIRKNILEVYGDDSKVTEKLVDRYYDLSLRAGNRDAFLDRAKMDFVDETDKLQSIQTPTLIMWGEEDVWIPFEMAEKFKDELPNSKLISYPKVGHVPMEEIPELTANDTRNFLRSK